jgi:hypothetical protein
MGLFSEWQALCQREMEDSELKEFWDTYFEAEKQNYIKILSNKGQPIEGKLTKLADDFDMNDVIFTGFLDGINTSLKQTVNLEKAKASTPISLAVDYDKLFFNMLDAKASWLYNLDEWDDILDEKRRKELAKEWRISKQAKSTKTGRNDPCPCGSGKKFKKCCG